jgi:sugar/nucleoside kinase (ribokinase family)
VANTGLALHRLGMPVTLVGKIADDHFGQLVRGTFNAMDPGLGDRLIVTPDSSTSYTLVFCLNGQDRMFLHSPGCNHTFTGQEIGDDLLAEHDHLHFGYPPLMARMYERDGTGLAELFQRAKQAGLTTSLDLSLPDADAESGRANWTTILARTLPSVDLFLPSIEELLYMLDRPAFDMLRGAVYSHLPVSLVERLATQCLSMGAKVVGIKVGSRGFFLRTAETLPDMGRGRPDFTQWTGQELWHPCFSVSVVGTTGAGDATIAGFLSAVNRGFGPLAACRYAVAVGANCCEFADATSGVRTWEQTVSRIDSGVCFAKP